MVIGTTLQGALSFITLDFIIFRDGRSSGVKTAKCLEKGKMPWTGLVALVSNVITSSNWLRSIIIF